MRYQSVVLPLSALIMKCLLICGCFQDAKLVQSIEELPPEVLSENALQMQFAEILATALADNRSLREFVKQRALDRLNGDYEVLVPMILEARLTDGKTVREVLFSAAKPDERSAAYETTLPLLSIYVPELPGFSASSWEPYAQIPRVAVRLKGSLKVPVFGKNGHAMLLDENLIPNFPVVVVKENERLIAKERNAYRATGSSFGHLLFENQVNAYYFADPIFDGRKGESQIGIAPLLRDYEDLDPINIKAYKSGSAWQRDYVYYNLTPESSQGDFRINYSEYIRSIRFKTGQAGLAVLDDKRHDPRIEAIKNKLKAPFWTEGHYEFRVTVVMFAQNGIGDSLTKIFTLPPSCLFEPQYRKVEILFFDFYILELLNPKPCAIRLELLPWDLSSYAADWEIVFHEFDKSDEWVHRQIELDVTHATNVSAFHKIGHQFGESAPRKETLTATLRLGIEADYLGKARLSFSDPVLVQQVSLLGMKFFVTHEIETESLMVSIEPARAW